MPVTVPENVSPLFVRFCRPVADVKVSVQTAVAVATAPPATVAVTSPLNTAGQVPAARSVKVHDNVGRGPTVTVGEALGDGAGVGLMV